MKSDNTESKDKNISILDRDLYTKNPNDSSGNLKNFSNQMTIEETIDIIEKIILELEEDKDDLIKVSKEEITDEKLNIEIPSKKNIFQLKSKKIYILLMEMKIIITTLYIRS